MNRRSLAKIKLVWPRRVQEFSYHHQHRIRRGLKYIAVALVALYFVTVVVSQVRINQREQNLPYQLASVAGEFFNYEENQVYYEVYPETTPLTSSTPTNTESRKFLLVHGFGASSLNWRDQIDYLRQYGRVVTVDLMGFGLSQEVDSSSLGQESQADMLNALLLHLGWPKATVIGHSLGGGVSMRLALDYSTKVEALILVDSIDLDSTGPDISGLGFLNGAFAAQIPLGLADSRSVIEQTLAAAVYDDSQIDDAWIDTYHRNLTIRGSTANLLAHGFAPQQNRLAELGKITQPVLLINGQYDTFIPTSRLANLKTGLPAGYEAVEIPGVGHNPQEEAPVIFNQVVGEWVRRIIASN